MRNHNLPEDLAFGRSDGFPMLAKMARQHLGRSSSLTGVKRMFSKAGRLHDDLQASQSDDTLEHALLVAANLSEESRRHCTRGFFERCSRRAVIIFGGAQGETARGEKPAEHRACESRFVR